MTPEIPEYVLLLESVLRPFVMTIALGLIWLGAARMPPSAKSRYTTAVLLSAALLGWEAAAQYFGEANTYLATIENPPVVPTILFGLLVPLAVAAIALWQSESIARLRLARSRSIGSWRLRSIASRAVYSLCFGSSEECLGNSRSQPALAMLRRASLPSSWLCSWDETQLARTGQHTSGAFSE